MLIVSNLALFILLFYLIGKAADIVIKNVRILGVNLGIKQFWLGLILGILTSAPEAAVGIEATIKNIPQLSFGNLMGGIVVLLGLILGLTVILDNGIDVNISLKPRELILMVVYISLPLWFILDGVLSSWEGLLLIVIYGLCIYYFIRTNSKAHLEVKLEKGTSNLRAIGFALLGMIGVIVIAKFIIDVSLPLVIAWHINPFFAGLILFSIGTNLPELTLALRSWQDGVRDLSFGNLMGSALANPLVIGLLSFINPISQVVGVSYYVFMICLVSLLITLVILSYTGRRLSVREGWVLVVFYLIFLITEFFSEWI